MLHERAVDALERLVHRSTGECEKRRRACRGREPPRTVEAAAVLLQLGRQLDGLVDLAELDERLDRVRVERVHRPLAEASVTQEGWDVPERVPRRLVVAHRELEVAQRLEVVREPDRRSDLPGVPDAVVQDAPCVVYLPETRRHEAARVPLLAQLPAELAVEVGELARVLFRCGEVAAPDLELDEVQIAPGHGPDPVELERPLEELAQQGARPGCVAGVEEGEGVPEPHALVRLAHATARLGGDPRHEERLVEPLAREEPRDAELAVWRGEHQVGGHHVGGRHRQLGVMQRRPVVASDPAHAGEYGVGGHVDVLGLRRPRRARAPGSATASAVDIVSICAPSQPSRTSARARSGPAGSVEARRSRSGWTCSCPSPAA